MNFKKISLLFLSLFIPLNAYYSKVKSIRRFQQAYTHAQSQKNPAKKKAIQAKYQLLRTEKGQMYHKALINCKNKQNCNECETFIAAGIELRKTDEYANDFLPVQLDHFYWHMKAKGLKSIMDHIEKNPNDEDFEALYSTVYHTLYTTLQPTIDALTTREMVHDELYEMIIKENSLITRDHCLYGKNIINHFEKIEQNMPKYR